MTSGKDHTPGGIIVRLHLVALLAIATAVLALPASPAHAQPTIIFHECEEPSPSPSPSPSPTPIPDPDPDPDPDPVDPEPEGCVPAEGDALRDTHTLRFTVSDVGSLRSFEVRLSVLSDESQIASPNAGQPVRTWTFDSGDERQQTLTYDWDTRRLTPLNGVYRIRVEVSESGPNGEDAEKARVGINVDNPPETPEAPNLVEVTEEGPVVAWSKAPEPDILSYAFYRARTASEDEKPENGDFKAIGTTGCEEQVCEFQDEVDGGGAYWYKVLSTRRSVVKPGGLIHSELSDHSAEPAIIEGPEEDGNGDPQVGPRANGNAGLGENRTERPRLTPRSVARPVQRPAPVPDAPFSVHLPYDVDEEGDGTSSFRRPREVDGEGADRQGVFAAAIGAFLIAAGLAVGRMPT